jgi:hypothetical protein
VYAASTRAAVSAFVNGYQNFLSSTLTLKIMHQMGTGTWALGTIRLVRTRDRLRRLNERKVPIGPIFRTTSPKDAGITT